MYRVNPYIDEGNMVVPIPQCMYTLPNIHGDNVGSPQTQRKMDECSMENVKILSAVQENQENVLKELDDIFEEILKMRKALKEHLSSVSSEAIAAVGSTNENASSAHNLVNLPNNEEIVIFAHPTKPPYSLSLVQKLLWKLEISVSTLVHVHSSVLEEKSSESIQELNKFLQNSANFEQKPSKTRINFCLIWSKLDETNQMLAVLQGGRAKIRGEVNFLRYMSRVFAPLLPYEELPIDVVFKIDHFLDAIYRLVDRRTEDISKLLSATIKSLGERKDQRFLIGDVAGFTIADVALYSAIIKLSDVKETNNKLVKQWLQNCANIGTT